MKVSIGNLFGVVINLIVFAGLVQVMNMAIGYALPNVGTLTGWVLRLFVPGMAIMMLSDAVEMDEPLRS